MPPTIFKRLPVELEYEIVCLLSRSDVSAISQTSRPTRNWTLPILFKHITLIEDDRSGYHTLHRHLQQFIITFYDNEAYSPMVHRVTIQINEHESKEWEAENYRFKDLTARIGKEEVDEKLARRDPVEQANLSKLIRIAKKIYHARPNLVLDGMMGLLVLLFHQLTNVTEFEYDGALVIEPLALSAVGFFRRRIPRGLQLLTFMTLTHPYYIEFNGGYGLFMIQSLFNLPHLESLVVERLGSENSIHDSENAHDRVLDVPSNNCSLKSLFLFRLYVYMHAEVSRLLMPLEVLVSVSIVIDGELEQRFGAEGHNESGESEGSEASDKDGDFPIMQFPRRFLALFHPSASTLRQLFIASVDLDSSPLRYDLLKSLEDLPQLVHVRLPISWILDDTSTVATASLESLPCGIRTIHFDLGINTLHICIQVLNNHTLLWKEMAPDLHEIVIFWGGHLSQTSLVMVKFQLDVGRVQIIPHINSTGTFLPRRVQVPGSLISRCRESTSPDTGEG